MMHSRTATHSTANSLNSLNSVTRQRKHTTTACQAASLRLPQQGADLAPDCAFRLPWRPCHLQLPQDTSEENWRNIFATNVDGIFHTVRAAYPLLKRSESSKVVITSSIGGEAAGSDGCTTCSTTVGLCRAGAALAFESYE
jgi:NAD(P)-dependent dehydrogenase (short-subunit alcohol dehydrogenase family)